MILKNPELLQKRLKAKEKESDQSLVVKLSGLMFIAGFMLVGLNGYIEYKQKVKYRFIPFIW